MRETAVAYTTFLTTPENLFSKQLVIPRLWPPKSPDLNSTTLQLKDIINWEKLYSLQEW